MPKSANKDYNASSITVLEGLEPVRKRPGMYIGSTGPEGLHHLIWEIIDNSFDEAMAGFCHNIRLSLLDDGSVQVEDDGRGIPVDMNKQYKKSGLELALTKLHAGGKFDNTTYKVSGGLHGVGVSVVNALSVTLKAQVCRDGKIWEQEYARGIPTSKLKSIGTTRKTGTTITFTPDSTIFPDKTFSWDTILSHLRQQAYLTRGIHLHLEDLREKDNPHSYSFLFEGGIASYVRHLNIHKSVLHPIPFSVSKETQECAVDIAFQYNDDYKETVLAFANNIYNPEGGTHVVGFRTSLTRSLNQYARGKGYLKEKDENLAGEDVREGLTAVISVKVSNPQFEGQTKSKLGNTEVRTAVEAIFSEQLAVYLEEHPKEAEVIIGKCLLTSRARIAARAARDTVLRKGVLEGLTLPGKLADCSSRDPKQTELYIVEGDSAGGCFSGDTKIALADGRALSFTQLVEEEAQGMRHFCYTIKSDGTIGIEEIKNPRCTRQNTEVINIILDTNEVITCTPDHLFMIRGGSYKKAADLTPADSLMPLNNWSLEHGVYQQEKTCSLSSSGLTRGSRNSIANFSGFPIKSGMTIDCLTYFQKTIQQLRMVYENFRRIDVGAYNNLRKEKNDKTLIRFDTFVHRFFNDDVEAATTAVTNYNHKIKRIERLQERMDVYDIEVPNTHNFALASGVFVHNSAKQGRDRNFQAILPLRGKILNVQRARLDKILSNNEVKSLIIAIGTNIGEQFDLSQLRYDRIIIMTDADVDGAHIRTLLLTLFYRYFPEIISTGHLYIAQPPLYRLSRSREMKYAYTEEDKLNILAEMQSSFAKASEDKKQKNKEVEQGSNEAIEQSEEAAVTSIGGVTIQRYKGLGEMNPEQLWETTMDPKTRMMRQVAVEDAQKADELFDILMGAEVAPRKHFIQVHAKTVKNLDI